jgi:hypothetical protein
MGFGMSFGIYWAIIHDQTNVEAQKVWSKEAQDFDQKSEFQKAHPKADVFSF